MKRNRLLLNACKNPDLLYNHKHHIDWVDENNEGVSHFRINPSLMTRDGIGLDTFHMKCFVIRKMIIYLRNFIFQMTALNHFNAGFYESSTIMIIICMCRGIRGPSRDLIGINLIFLCDILIQLLILLTLTLWLIPKRFEKNKCPHYFVQPLKD